MSLNNQSTVNILTTALPMTYAIKVQQMPYIAYNAIIDLRLSVKLIK